MTNRYRLRFDDAARFITQNRWACDGEPILKTICNSHDIHGCPGWRAIAWCPSCNDCHSFFITRHEGILNHLVDCDEPDHQ